MVSDMQCVIRYLRVFEYRTDGIQSKAIHAQIEPESDCIPHALFYFGVAPVQIWLLLEKHMIVVLACQLIVFPGRTTEDRGPIVGCPIVLPIPPDVPGAFRIIAAGSRFEKPGMLVRGVIEHEVENKADVAR